MTRTFYLQKKSLSRQYLTTETPRNLFLKNLIRESNVTLVKMKGSLSQSQLNHYMPHSFKVKSKHNIKPIMQSKVAQSDKNCLSVEEIINSNFMIPIKKMKNEANQKNFKQEKNLKFKTYIQSENSIYKTAASPETQKPKLFSFLERKSKDIVFENERNHSHQFKLTNLRNNCFFNNTNFTQDRNIRPKKKGILKKKATKKPRYPENLPKKSVKKKNFTKIKDNSCLLNPKISRILNVPNQITKFEFLKKKFNSKAPNKKDVDALTVSTKISIFENSMHSSLVLETESLVPQKRVMTLTNLQKLFMQFQGINTCKYIGSSYICEFKRF